MHVSDVSELNKLQTADLKSVIFFKGCMEPISLQNIRAPSMLPSLDFSSFSNLPHWSSSPSTKTRNMWWSKAFRGVFTNQNEIFTKTRVLNMKNSRSPPFPINMFMAKQFSKMPCKSLENNTRLLSLPGIITLDEWETIIHCSSTFLNSLTLNFLAMPTMQIDTGGKLQSFCFSIWGEIAIPKYNPSSNLQIFKLPTTANSMGILPNFLIIMMIFCSLKWADWNLQRFIKILVNKLFLFKSTGNSVGLGILSTNSNDVFTLILFLSSKNNLISLHNSRNFNFYS